eukprot:symbB.v1.2.001401.t2/scaffold75.1/size348941/7
MQEEGVTLAISKNIGSETVELAVFKLLGEHVLERMFDAAPLELAESLLAIAVFCCSRHHRLPDPALEVPWHPAVFDTAADCLAAKVSELPAQVLLKSLRRSKFGDRHVLVGKLTMEN